MRPGSRNKETLSQLPGPQPYLIAFQPTHELFFNPILFSLKRLVTQKVSKFPIISRREETPKQNLQLSTSSWHGEDVPSYGWGELKVGL